jgi:hypothetical protein
MGSEKHLGNRSIKDTAEQAETSSSRRGVHSPHRTLTILLKVTDACAVACLALILVAMPAAEKIGELKHGSTLFAAVGMLPLAMVAACAWRLFSAIGRDETFTTDNVRRLRAISISFAVSAAIWLIELITVIIASDNNRRLVILGLGVAFLFCSVITVVSAALASLASTATELKNENDLVI